LPKSIVIGRIEFPLYWVALFSLPRFSSSEWLVAFAAILPVIGRSNGWLVARYNFDHSPSSISARRVLLVEYPGTSG
jgi:hypothetical protein